MLRVYREALDVVGELVPYSKAIERRDPDLGRQLKKARSSVLLETAFASRSINELPVPLIEKLRKSIGTLHKCIHGSKS